MSEKHELRREEIEGVLSGDEAPADEGPQPYSLREPQAIPPHAMETARATMRSIVSIFDEAFRAEAAVELGLDDLQQQSTRTALSTLPPTPWIAGLARPGNGGLALALSPGVGMALVDLAMGGAGEVPVETREPTALESRVLNRLVASAAKRLQDLLGAKLGPVECETGGIPPSIATPGETVAVGLLRFHVGEGDHASLLLVTASMLVPDARPAEPRGDRRIGPLAPALEKVALNIRPVLGAGAVSFRELMALESGNVLRLDVDEDAIFELRAEGEPVAWGRIVRRDDGSVFEVQRMRAERTSERRRRES